MTLTGNIAQADRLAGGIKQNRLSGAAQSVVLAQSRKPPVAEYAPSYSEPIWVGETFVFKRYGRPTGGEPDWFKWYLNIGNGYELVAETQDVEVEVTPDGSANVFFLKLTCGNEYGESESLDNQIAHLTAGPPVTAPLADFEVWPRNVYVGESVFFVQTETNHQETSYRWYANDVLIGSGEGFLHVFTEAGTYTIKLIATNSAGVATETKTNYIGVASPTNEGAHLAEFFMPSILANENVGLYFYNDGDETVTLVGRYYNASGAIMSGDPLGGEISLPPGLGVIVGATTPSDFVTLRIFPTSGRPAVAADLVAQIGIQPSEYVWLWADVRRPRVVIDGTGEPMRARIGIVDSEPFDSGWVIVNCTAFNGQNPRPIECTYTVTQTGGQTVIQSGTITIPASGLYGFRTSLMGLELSGWFDLKVEATCKEHELAVVQFLYFDYEGVKTHTHSFSEFMRLN